MKVLYQYIRTHIQEDFHLGYYISVLLFLSVCLFFNYNYNLESQYLDPLFGTFSHFLVTLASMTTLYIGTMIIQQVYGRKVWKADYKFWLALAFILIIESHDLSFAWYRAIVNSLPNDLFLLALRSSKNILSIFTVLLPLWIFHKLSDSRSRFYGLTTDGFSAKPYIILCSIALMGIALSLYSGDISSYYPTYKPAMATYFPNNTWLAVLIYEFFYAFDFIGVEMVFRGFMVIGLARWLGKEAIIPMTSVYCLLHFGKPLPEAISSIFGGYLLGIFAYRSKSVLGGVFIHITIALGMEFFSYLLK